jgi:GPH family glycoside/pentoside/hexuronide:cation symporter
MDSSDVPARDAAAAGSMSPTIGQKVFYSLGQAAQSGGFDTAVGFVFFYYSVVLGLSGALVGAALAIGLAFDAVVDPFIGSWSDNLKSRLGRRLPLMMAAILPTVVSVGLLTTRCSHSCGLSRHLDFTWQCSMSDRIAHFMIGLLSNC